METLDESETASAFEKRGTFTLLVIIQASYLVFAGGTFGHVYKIVWDLITSSTIAGWAGFGAVFNLITLAVSSVFSIIALVLSIIAWRKFKNKLYTHACIYSTAPYLLQVTVNIVIFRLLLGIEYWCV